MPEETNQSMSNEDRYLLHIENFDGPLDLLWELIKKSKIDITEVSISHITEQYISYLKLMESLNIKIATDFIRMASELLYYKSRALLPASEMEDEYFVPPLPPELIKKLLEFKQFQKASLDMKGLYDSQTNIFSRTSDLSGIIGEEEYIEVTLFDLLGAFARVMESVATVEKEEIIFDEVLVSDRIEHITGLLKERDSILFEEIFSGSPNRAEIVASFLATLEMTKTSLIKIMQHRVFGSIRILRNFTVQSLS
ncbi:MAG: segregation/condensation protein A [Spirochaetes bacterium]|jgi:segregation and condensation protein A|nr:segregation/condensation protein A [Spirochaetota bacterium]